MYYMGIDGGGTKSRLIITDEDNHVLGSYEGLDTNICANTKSCVKNNIRNLVEQFLNEHNKRYSECLGICIGSAGIDTEKNVNIMEEILAEIGFSCPMKVVNDAEIILWSELLKEPGIILISGTGSVAYGKNQDGTVLRSGGWGHLFDDEGSGYWIGKEILNRAFKSFDGREQDTILKKYLMDWFNADTMDELIAIIYEKTMRKKDIAALSVLAIRGMKAYDLVSQAILDDAAYCLFQIYESLYRRLNLKESPPQKQAADGGKESPPQKQAADGGKRVTSRLVIYGGNLEHNDYLRTQFSMYVNKYCPGVQIGNAKQDAALGAAYLAKEMAAIFAK